MTKNILSNSWKMLLLATLTGILGGVSGAALIMAINRALSGSGDWATLAWTFFGLCLVHVVAKTCATITLMRLAQWGCG